MIFCFSCGAVVLDKDMVLVTVTINSHPGTFCSCEKCVEKIKKDKAL